MRGLAGLIWLSGCMALGQTPASKVEWIKAAPQPGLAHLPADAPQPVLYYARKAKTPSCGLRPMDQGQPSATILPMLETEPGDDFPYCEAVTDEAAFEFGGNAGFVFRYKQRDTREDSSAAYFFVLQTDGAWRPLDKLNSVTTPGNKSIRTIAAWGKSKLVGEANEKEGYQTIAADSMSTESSLLNVSRNATTGQCRIVVDLVEAKSSFAPLDAPCASVLASTLLTAKDASYFIVLFEGTDHQTAGRVFSVQEKSVQESTDLEKRLAAEIAGGKILPVKAALRALVASH